MYEKLRSVCFLCVSYEKSLHIRFVASYTDCVSIIHSFEFLFLLRNSRHTAIFKENSIKSPDVWKRHKSHEIKLLYWLWRLGIPNLIRFFSGKGPSNYSNALKDMVLITEMHLLWHHCKKNTQHFWDFVCLSAAQIVCVHICRIQFVCWM